MIDNVFVIGFLVMIVLGGFVFFSEKILKRFPNIKNKLENLFSDESYN